MTRSRPAMSEGPRIRPLRSSPTSVAEHSGVDEARSTSLIAAGRSGTIVDGVRRDPSAVHHRRGNTIITVDDWRIDDFAAALTSLSDNTVAAYTSDLRSFSIWCARSEIHDPALVKRTTIRRYLAHLTTRQFARRTIARKTAAIRRYYRWLVAIGTGRGRSDQRRVGPRRPRPTPAGARPARAVGSARWRRRPMASPTGGAGATTPCSSCCTAPVCGSASSVGCRSRRCRSTAAAATVWGKGAKERRVPVSEPAVRAVRRWLAVRGEVLPPEAGDVLFGNERGRRADAARRPPDHRPPVAERQRIRTRCVTPSPPTCSTVAPTCERCRSCSVTPMSRRRSDTLTSAGSDCRLLTARPTPEHEHRSRRPRPPDAVDALAEPPQHRRRVTT